MTKQTIYVPVQSFREVNRYLKSSGVKFYPFIRKPGGHHIAFEPKNHPLITFLLLKYKGIKLID